MGAVAFVLTIGLILDKDRMGWGNFEEVNKTTDIEEAPVLNPNAVTEDEEEGRQSPY